MCKVEKEIRGQVALSCRQQPDMLCRHVRHAIHVEVRMVYLLWEVAERHVPRHHLRSHLVHLGSGTKRLPLHIEGARRRDLLHEHRLEVCSGPDVHVHTGSDIHGDTLDCDCLLDEPERVPDVDLVLHRRRAPRLLQLIPQRHAQDRRQRRSRTRLERESGARYVAVVRSHVHLQGPIVAPQHCHIQVCCELLPLSHQRSCARPDRAS
mmetsp:Transcript_1433/g.3139  ORF Transcript_1433/g.3139 Transcript_1433/m.3139 type:complete len:208 (+) Transcript_1433:1423-2046(+)